MTAEARRHKGSYAGNRGQELASLHREILACRCCEEGGLIPQAAPVVSNKYIGGSRIMLIGQAPGQVEMEQGEPFRGRAGRMLCQWMQRAGMDEATFRRTVYITSVTKCFPGKSGSRGGGDRRPSLEEVRLCRPFLERQISIINPVLILLVGRMAIDLYLPGTSLEEVVGQFFEVGGRQLLPLPHPSGMSRWLNDEGNRQKLDQALELLQLRAMTHEV